MFHISIFPLILPSHQKLGSYSRSNHSSDKAYLSSDSRRFSRRLQQLVGFYHDAWFTRRLVYGRIKLWHDSDLKETSIAMRRPPEFLARPSTRRPTVAGELNRFCARIVGGSAWTRSRVRHGLGMSTFRRLSVDTCPIVPCC